MSIPELKDCTLDHIAVAVEDIGLSVKMYEDFGLKFSDKREVIEAQAVEVAFAHIDENAHLELLCPWGKAGPIHKFLEKKGPGIHHICFRVKDIISKTKVLEKKGYIFLNDHPIEGAGNKLVNFIHPKSTGGVLIELSQERK